MDACRLDATEALARLRDGRLTTAALMAACLERIAAREPQVRAFAHLDAGAAMRQAEADDARGRRHGLCGMPVGVKDIFDTADMPTAYGSARLAGHRPDRDAACVTALRRAGAVLPGKTATTEFAGPQPAPTRHPENPGVSPGGSSSGSVAAVADFMLPFAVGTQTAGSIVRPAAFCGIVGIKPTYGLIDIAGVHPAAPSFDTIGTFGRTVADAALLLAAITGDPALAPAAIDTPPRIGVCRTPAWDKADADVQAALDDAAALFARAGAGVVDLPLSPAFDRAIADQATIMSAETFRVLRAVLESGTDGLGPDTVAAARAGALVTAPAEQAARDAFAGYRAAFAGVLDGIDVLICPSAAAEAPEGLGWTGDPVFNRLWSGLGVPCLTLPFTRGDRGLPIGVQVVGPRGGDARLVAAALWLERAIGMRVPQAERA